jgi:uridine kinase
MTRQDTLDQLAGRISALEPAHPVRVAIDGVDAAGKTMLADELARVLGARARPVIRASIDGFHRPRAERYRQGSGSIWSPITRASRPTRSWPMPIWRRQR